MKECIIDLIVEKKEKAHVIYEDNLFIAFLDTHPLFLGHTLLATKAHYDTFYNIPAHLLSPLFSIAQSLGKAVEKAMNAEGSFIAMNNTISQSISHVHIHIVPRKKGDGLKGFFWPRTKYDNQEQMIKIQEQITTSLHQIIDPL
jgi:histidine triad (HIT) family protein